MDRFKVESTNIAEIGYDPDTSTLEIKFTSGGIYQYWPITQSGWELFLKADSKGSFFYKNIKSNSGVNYRRLDDMQADNKSH
jgi:hypothetical protein